MSLCTDIEAPTSTASTRRVASGSEPIVLADVYQEYTHLAIWQRTLGSTLTSVVSRFVKEKPNFQTSMTVTPEHTLSRLNEIFGDTETYVELAANIAELVDVFCYLFDLNQAGLRLTVLDDAMCPRFHVDRVPCRLVTTYCGSATQWLAHESVDRSKLGRGAEGLPDEQSGIYKNDRDIRQMTCGDVALLKGELWEGNENAGLVHRSPALAQGERRLLMTLDFAG